MKIPIKCKCGKVLYVPQQYAGKRGRCPQCACLLVVPDASKFVPNTAEAPTKMCPTCGAYLGQEDEFCISCKMNLKTGQWNLAEYFPVWKRVLPKYLMSFYGVVSLMAIFCMAAISWKSNRELQLLQMKQKRFSENVDAFRLLPEETQEEFFEKMHFGEQLKREKIGEFCEIFCRLKKQKEELELCRQFERQIKERKDIFGIWLRLLLALQTAQSEQGKKRIQSQLHLVQPKIHAFLASQRGELKQLVEEERVKEIVTRVTPRILSQVIEGLDGLDASSTIRQIWQDIVSTYEKLPLEKKEEPVKHPKHDDRLIKAAKTRFVQLLPKFNRLMKQREYDKAQDILENLWQILYTLEDVESGRALVAEVRRKLKDVQSIKALFSIAHEGAKKSVGDKKYIRVGEKEMTGTIVQYELGTLYLKTSQNETVKIRLKELQPEEIGFFSLKYEKNKYVYQYLGIFYLYENLYSSAEAAFSEAVKSGMKTNEIAHYLNLIEKSLSEPKE